MSLQPHEIELNKIERDAGEEALAYIAFRKEAVARVKECFLHDGDLIDLLNTLDLEYSDEVSLVNWQINDIVNIAVKGE